MKTYIKLTAAICIMVNCALFISGCVGQVNATPSINNNNPTQSCTKDAPLFTREIALELITRWGNGLKWQGNNDDLRIAVINQVVDNYSHGAVLLPTLGSAILNKNQKLYGYFYGTTDKPGFMAKKPQMTLTNLVDVTPLQCGDGVVNGDYKFTIPNGSGGNRYVNARFSFVFRYFTKPLAATIELENGIYNVARNPGWYIVTHHSSLQPIPSTVTNYDELERDFNF